MDYLVAILIGIAISALAVWLCVGAAVVILRPDCDSLKAVARLPGDLLGFVRRLSRDPELPRGARVRMRVLLAYLLFPIDLVPDFIPVIGYADDVVITLLLLRSVVHAAGAARIAEHWTGDPAGLAAIRQLCGVEAKD